MPPGSRTPSAEPTPGPGGAAGAGLADGLACGNCGAPMSRLQLPGHYGHAVELDLCPSCHLVWFDPLEAARFGGAALLDLVGAMAAAQKLPHQPLRPDIACPRCRGPLKQVHNRTRWGASVHLECRRGHGGWTSFGEFLAERGLVRSMSGPDRHAWLAKNGRLDCLNCGAALGAADETCPWCQSVPSLFDIARLAHALDPEGAAADAPARHQGAERASRQCLACGAAVPARAALRCPQCDATLAVGALAQAHERLVPLAPSLRAPDRRPPRHVVQARLAAQSADLPRRRAWAARMQAEADARQGRLADPGIDFDSTDAAGLLAWLARPGAAWRVVLWALLALFLWWIA